MIGAERIQQHAMNKTPCKISENDFLWLAFIDIVAAVHFLLADFLLYVSVLFVCFCLHVLARSSAGFHCLLLYINTFKQIVYGEILH